MHFAEAISQCRLYSKVFTCLPGMTGEHGKLWIFCKEGFSQAEGKLVFLKHAHQVNCTRIVLLILIVEASDVLKHIALDQKN